VLGSSNGEASKVAGSLLSLLVIAWLDREITKGELKYLLREFKHWVSVEESMREKLLNALSLFVKTKEYNETIIVHLNSLSFLLDAKEKKFLIETLIIVSRSDLKVAKVEERFIYDIGRFLKVGSAEIKETLVNAHFIVMQRLGKDEETVSGDDELHIVPSNSWEHWG
jgi:uncharacterized tellurite resistance protein B-like protein